MEWLDDPAAPISFRGQDNAAANFSLLYGAMCVTCIGRIGYRDVLWFWGSVSDCCWIYDMSEKFSFTIKVEPGDQIKSPDGMIMVVPSGVRELVIEREGPSADPYWYWEIRPPQSSGRGVTLVSYGSGGGGGGDESTFAGASGG